MQHVFIHSCVQFGDVQRQLLRTSADAVDSGEAPCGAADNGVCSVRAMLKHPLSLHSSEEAVAGDAEALLQFGFL